MTYKEEITGAITWLGKKKKVVFIGEGLINAGRVYGTLNGVSSRQCIEMPIAENLIMGAAIGLSLEGYLPVAVFQRMDFMLIAADQIINHLALIPKMSGGRIQIPLIIRAIVGSQDPKFDVGPQHNHDFAHVFDKYIFTKDFQKGLYEWAYEQKYPTLVIEERDLYNEKVEK